ncbi:MAG: alpha/beta hydrolase [Promethearchaeota archaeon]
MPVVIVLLFKYKWRGPGITRTIIGFCKVLLIAFSLLTFSFSAFSAFHFLSGGYPRIAALNFILPMIILTLILSLPIVTLLLYKLIPKEHNKILKSITIMGFILTMSFSLPFLTTPISIIDANMQFSDAFGGKWNEFHPAVEEEFLDMHQVLIESWFGAPDPDPDSWRLDSNRVYKETEDYKLKFDVYYPGPKAAQFIGEKATIIFMHGGGFTFGDKTNNVMYFKYFAAQGYVVFSIDYRLVETDASPRQSYVGDYNI